MKKALKLFNIVMIIALIFITSSTIVFAAEGKTGSSGVDPSGFTGSSNTELTSGINDFGNSVISVVSTIGSIAAVVVLVVLGLKYMMGSAEEKAEYKKTLIPYVIGAVLVFAASTIAGVIFNFAGNFGQ